METPEVTVKDWIKSRSNRWSSVVLVALTMTGLLGACNEIDAGIIDPAVPTPISSEYNNPTQEATETSLIDQTENAPIITEAAGTPPEKPLEVELAGIDGLDQPVKENLNEQTSEFIEAVANTINNDPALKAAFYDENGLKVAFDPNRLIYHDGIWGYFAPEGGSLSNNLLIISNAQGSEGEIRFCSFDGAASKLGLDLTETSHYLDFDNVNGNNVCLVRQESDDSVVAINNAQGQWSLPEESGLKIIIISQTSAREDGQTALQVAQEETIKQTQEAIRAEILSYGINLDDLANSDNEYIRNYPNIGDWQKRLDNSFNKTEPSWETMIVLDIEQLQNLEEYEEAFTTDGGWKFRAWAKVAYKDAVGNWVIANLPLDAYNENTKELWRKMAENAGPLIYPNISYEAATTTSFSKDDTRIIDWFQENFQLAGNFYIDTGAIFKLFTEYPNPEVNNSNSGEVGEIPRYTEEAMEQFWLTGNPSIFRYQATDGTYFIWPFVHYDSGISHIDHQTP